MNISTRSFRKNVKGWLIEEKATIDQATELLSAIHAGAILGVHYDGHRMYEDADLQEAAEVKDNTKVFNNDEGNEYEDEYNCGCLVDTLEKIKNYRPSKDFDSESETLKTFALAMMINLGDTPSNSKWARAAAKGIEDYLTGKELV